MTSSQCYLGTPNSIVVCIDTLGEDHSGSGMLYHLYSKAGTPFLNYSQLTMLMEQLFDELNYPYPSTDSRSFLRSDGGYPVETKRKKVMNDNELLEKRGNMGTFIVRVQHRQNSSWQGRLTWVEKNKTINFRSVWEMIKLMDGAMDSQSPDIEAPTIVWEDEKDT